MSRVASRRTLGLALPLVVLAITVAFDHEVVLRAAEATLVSPTRFGAFLVVLYLLRPALGLPTMLVAGVVGYGFGAAVGFPVALLGTTLSSLPPYAVAARLRPAGGPIGRWADFGSAYVDATGDLRGLLAARLAPLPSDAVSYAAGLARVRPGTYLLATAVGELHWTAIAVIAGASTRRLVTAPLDAVPPSVVVLAAAAAVLLVLRPLTRHLVLDSPEGTGDPG